MNARVKVCKHRQLKFVIAITPSAQQKFENTNSPSLRMPLPKFDTLLQKPKSFTRFRFHVVAVTQRGYI